jgi:putative transposase
MPRTARGSAGGHCFHVLNRGNDRDEVFHSPNDYEAFLQVLAEVTVRRPVRFLASCFMPNHFHFVCWHQGDGDLPLGCTGG